MPPFPEMLLKYQKYAQNYKCLKNSINFQTIINTTKLENTRNVKKGVFIGFELICMFLNEIIPYFIVRMRNQ